MTGGCACANVCCVVLRHGLDPGASNPPCAQEDGWQGGAVAAPIFSGILVIDLAEVRALKLSIGQWLTCFAAQVVFGVLNFALSMIDGAAGV